MSVSCGGRPNGDTLEIFQTNVGNWVQVAEVWSYGTKPDHGTCLAIVYHVLSDNRRHCTLLKLRFEYKYTVLTEEVSDINLSLNS